MLFAVHDINHLIDIHAKRLTDFEKWDWTKWNSIRASTNFACDQRNWDGTKSQMQLQLENFQKTPKKVELEAIAEQASHFLTKVYIPTKLNLWYRTNAFKLFT